MRSVVYKNSKMQLIQREEPQVIRPDDVKIKIAYCGICGSDLHIVRKELDFMFAELPYLTMGHEASGVIVELGPEATNKGLKVGDKVVYYYNEHCGKCYYCVNGMQQFCENMQTNGSAMSDYIVVNEQAVYKLPADTDLARAALVEPISVCLHGIDMIGIQPGKSVFISGGGTMGMILAQLAKLSGGVNLTISEPIEAKRKVALECGVEYVIDPINQDVYKEAMKITKERGYDVVIECSGSAAACPSAYAVTGKGGTLEFFAALYPVDYSFPLNLQQAFYKEVKIISGVYQSPYTFSRSVALLPKMNFEPFFKENIFKPEEMEAAFAAQLNGKTVKSLIRFS